MLPQVRKIYKLTIEVAYLESRYVNSDQRWLPFSLASPHFSRFAHYSPNSVVINNKGVIIFRRLHATANESRVVTNATGAFTRKE
jgi:hypothetical protein